MFVPLAWSSSQQSVDGVLNADRESQAGWEVKTLTLSLPSPTVP